MKPRPIYTLANCRIAYQLNWSLSIFWRTPPGDAHWLDELKPALEPDGIRVLEHRFAKPNVSQFLLSTTPDVAPAALVRLVKGRLYQIVRERVPKPFRRNYAFRTVGSGALEAVERYVAGQCGHHPMADERVQRRLEALRIDQADVDLSAPRETTHARYWYTLHVVLVNAGRQADITRPTLRTLHDRIPRVARAKGHSLSTASILADHVHLTVGCDAAAAPGDVGLAYLNNLAFALGERPFFQFGFYVGTFGEYDLGAIRKRLET